MLKFVTGGNFQELIILITIILNSDTLFNQQDLSNSYKPGVFLLDIGKQHSPRCDAAEPSGAILFVQTAEPSGAILFVQRNFIEK